MINIFALYQECISFSFTGCDVHELGLSYPQVHNSYLQTLKKSANR
jgi:hypothetical protein